MNTLEEIEKEIDKEFPFLKEIHNDKLGGADVRIKLFIRQSLSELLKSLVVEDFRKKDQYELFTDYQNRKIGWDKCNHQLRQKIEEMGIKLKD